jgi:hypothetical protein
VKSKRKIKTPNSQTLSIEVFAARTPRTCFPQPNTTIPFLWFSFGFLKSKTLGKPKENPRKTQSPKKTKENQRKPEEKKTAAPPAQGSRIAPQEIDEAV